MSARATLQESDKENRPPTSGPNPTASAGQKRSAPADDEVFTRGRKQPRTDPLVHYGRHFGRTIRAFCRVHSLITNGVNRMLQIELDRMTEEELDASELAEHQIYQRLLALVPNIEEKLNTGSNQELIYIADMITKGSSSARSDDTRSLKSAIVDWITPSNGLLNPPLIRNVKTGRGFHHSRTGELLCPVNFNWEDPKVQRDLASGQLVPSGDLWPRFLYRGYSYDSQNPWEGLFRSALLVLAYKHVFTSPSSALDGANPGKSTRSSNARIHGMKQVTVPSIAYIATQVRFALNSTATFSRNDTVTDSEYFYFLIVDLLEDPEEHQEVDALLAWWNQQIFPVHVNHNDTRSVHEDSVIAKIKERRRQLREASDSGSASTGSPSTPGVSSSGAATAPQQPPPRTT